MSTLEAILTLSPPRATITLNRPRNGNSLSPQSQQLILSYLDQISKDDLIHYLVLTGNGKFFSTGMDLGESGGAAEGGDQDLKFQNAKHFFQKVEMFDKPIIALANGPCYGGGVGLFFLSDIRLCPISTSFTLTEVKRGLVAASISPTIIREWGISLSRLAMLTSKPMTARELERVGSVITFQGGEKESEEKLTEICDLIEKCGPKAMMRSKRLIRTQASTGLNILESASVMMEKQENLGSREAIAFKELKDAFQEMMAPSQEALEGILMFRKSKGKKDVDWLEFYKEKEKEKEKEKGTARSKL